MRNFNRTAVSFLLVISLLMIGAAPASANTKTPIVGQSELIAYQMGDYVLMNNPNPRLVGVDIYELAQLFLDIGRVEGIRGDIAFAQSIKETGFFKYGGDVIPEQNNYSGIGTVGGGVLGAFFKTPEEGVLAQIQHLKAYANKEALVMPNVDPRFHLVTRGIAPNWEDLNGRWAVPGKGYGEDILRIYKSMEQLEVKIPNVELPSNHGLPVAKMFLRSSEELLTPNLDVLRTLKRGQEYYVYGVQGNYYDVGGGYLVKSNSATMNILIGRLNVQKDILLYAPNGQVHRTIKKGEAIRVYSYNDQNYQVGGGYYVKATDAPFYLGFTTVINDTPLYAPDGTIHRMLKKGEMYRTYKLDNNKIDLGGGYYVDKTRDVKFNN